MVVTTSGDLMYDQKALYIKAQRCTPMAVGAHVILWWCAVSGCQLWVLVGAPVCGLSAL